MDFFAQAWFNNILEAYWKNLQHESWIWSRSLCALWNLPQPLYNTYACLFEPPQVYNCNTKWSIWWRGCVSSWLRMFDWFDVLQQSRGFWCSNNVWYFNHLSQINQAGVWQYSCHCFWSAHSTILAGLNGQKELLSTINQNIEELNLQLSTLSSSYIKLVTKYSAVQLESLSITWMLLICMIG